LAPYRDERDRRRQDLVRHIRGTGRSSQPLREIFRVVTYRLCTTVLCEVTPSAVLVASELFGTRICVVAVAVVCIGVPVPFAVTLPQDVS
jgi:hypothetical protein